MLLNSSMNGGVHYSAVSKMTAISAVEDISTLLLLTVVVLSALLSNATAH